MLLAGIGMGATMQNLVLAVQNSVSIKVIGSASATVAFLRSLGGAIGVSALGAVLASQVTSHVRSGLAGLGVNPSAAGASGDVPNPASLPAPVAHVVENAYGIGTAWVFGISAVAALIGALVIPFIREVPLRSSNDDSSDNDSSDNDSSDNHTADALQEASIAVAASEGVAEPDSGELISAARTGRHRG
jgi:hypothetical protein